MYRTEKVTQRITHHKRAKRQFDSLRNVTTTNVPSFSSRCWVSRQLLIAKILSSSLTRWKRSRRKATSKPTKRLLGNNKTPTNPSLQNCDWIVLSLVRCYRCFIVSYERFVVAMNYSLWQCDEACFECWLDCVCSLAACL